MRRPLLAIVLCTACASQSTGSSPAALPRDIRALSILPESPRACPGTVVAAQYVASLGDGSKVTLTPGQAGSLARRGAAVAPRADGEWMTSGDALASAVSGFHLHAALATDSSVRADTVVAPRYDCNRGPIVLHAGATSGSPAYIRLGTFPTPFSDSIVVAVLEIDGHAAVTTVLAPREMRTGAITVQASGRDGRPGRPGQPGRTGGDCSDGDEGGDGGYGENGQPGGEVNIIVEHDASWLADLIVVQNTGGRGGAGGAGGRGGFGGPTMARSGGDRCTTKAGRAGSNGPPGVSAGAGRSPKITSVLYALLWSGSPIWSDSVARSGIEALIAYEAKRRR